MQFAVSRVRVAAILAGGLVLNGCSSPSAPANPAPAATTLPPAVACTFQTTLTQETYGPGASSGHVEITTDPGCAWKATTTATWISFVRAEGTGSGSAFFTVAAHAEPGTRQTSIAVADQQHTVTQRDQPLACDKVYLNSYDLPAPASREQRHGTIRVLGALPDCAWNVSVEGDWIRLTSAAAGLGPGGFSYEIQEYAVAAGTANRTGQLRVNWSPQTLGQRVYSVSQSASPCSLRLALPPGKTGGAVPYEGGSGHYFVLVEPYTSGPWRASSVTPWITVTQGTAWGRGDGDLHYTVAANDSASPRVGTIVACDQTLTISQANRQ